MPEDRTMPDIAPLRPAPLFEVVLHEPEIPNNTGNIGRTCVATGCGLTLIHPLGFDISEKACRRAGLDYWPRLRVTHAMDWNDFASRRARESPGSRTWLFSSTATRSVFDVPLRAGDALVFGKETAGLPDAILRQHQDTLLTLPMLPEERSLNLATAVCAAVYEAVRQQLSRGVCTLDARGRLVLPTLGSSGT